MNTIELTASRDALVAAQKAAGQANDHLATALHVTLDETVKGPDYTYRLLFEAGDGYRCMSELLLPDATGTLTFALPNVLMVAGVLQVQLLTYEGDTVIMHTPKCTPALEIAPSITADTAMPKDYTGITYPGVGIASVDVVNGRLIITYEDGRTHDAGTASNALGEWGTATRLVEDVETEVAEYHTRGTDTETTDYVRSYALDLFIESELLLQANERIDVHSFDEVKIDSYVGTFIHNLQDPAAAGDAVNKRYVDGLVGDVETALEAIITMQEALIGGADA